jgi:hypothetical protein
MATVEQVIKALSDYDPKEEMLVIYWDKSLGREWVEETLATLKEEHKLTDEQVNQMFNEAWTSVTDESYDTGEVGSAILEQMNEWFDESIAEFHSEKEDTELWDTKGVTNVNK